MNFLQMKQDLADRLSAFDEAVSSDNTRLGRWINRAQDEFATAWDFTFNEQLDIIQTTADISTGTVSVVSGATSITLSSGPADSVTGRFIKFGSASDWYEITAHTAGSTTATINPAYSGTTLPGSDYIIRRFRYSLASNAFTIMDAKIAYNVNILKSMSETRMDLLSQMTSGTGTPTAYFLTTPASDGSPRIGFYPNPDGVYNVYIREKFKMATLSADSDTSIIPGPYHDTVVTLASYYGFLKLNSMDRAVMVYREYNDSMREIQSKYLQDKGRVRVMRSIDSTDAYHNGPVMPPNYGPMTYQ